MNGQFTIRIYDNNVVKRLNELFKDCGDVYATKNPFIIDCITKGMDSIERDLLGVKKIESLTELYDEIHATFDRLNELIKLCEESAKENMANNMVNQKLLSCNYNMLLGISDDTPCKKDFVEAGMFDDLPDRLAEVLEEVLKTYLKK